MCETGIFLQLTAPAVLCVWNGNNSTESILLTMIGAQTVHHSMAQIREAMGLL